MQSMSLHGTTIRSYIIAYALKTVLIVFGIIVVLAYAYILFIGLTTDRISAGQMITPMIIILVPFVLGWLIDKKHPGHTIALLFLLMAYSSSVSTIALGIRHLNESLSTPYADSIHTITLILGHIMWLPGVYLPLFFMPLYFPTGKLLSPRWVALVFLFLGNQIWTAITVILRPWPWPAYGIADTRSMNGIPGSEPFFDAIWNVLSIVSAFAVFLVPIGMFLRYRRSQGVERIQMRWPIAAVVLFIFLGMVLLIVPGLATIDAELGYPITWSLAMLFPVSIGVAILRYRLFDIDILINRTLVYGSLTGLIVALYVGIVGGLGKTFQAGANTLSGVVAAGVIAVVFQPLRELLQRGVNRLMYGERDDPAAVLTRLAQQMETADTPADILPNLVYTIAHALKIPHVAIWLPNEEDQFEPVAVWGLSPGYVEMIPLTYQKENIGQLVVAPRSRHESFNRGEQRLLHTIAALTANTVRAVQLSDELRQSRRRIITAREDERRRVRRDLHDGLGPQLASQTLGLEAVAQLMPSNPEKAQVLLHSLKVQAQEAIQDVRRLVYDLRPPTLDDLGLVGALQQSAARYESASLHFTFDLPGSLPELPAAVETAAYRIAQEAMTNIMRHARASHGLVRLTSADHHLVVEIHDDGQGLPTEHHFGVGLQSMRERAAELDGEFVIKSRPGGGTIVEARLPLEVSDA
jgi:signal transduction histidine kinase